MQEGRKIGAEVLKSLGEEDKQLVLLREAHNELVTVYNKNTRAMQQALQHLELRINAIRHVVDDVIAAPGSVTLVGPGEPGYDPEKPKVHWLGYHEFALQQMKAELAQVQAEAEALKDANEPVTDAGDADVVFGG